jgi:hypothetical protein
VRRNRSEKAGPCGCPAKAFRSLEKSGMMISKHAPFTRVVELDTVFAAVVSALYDDIHFVIQLSGYKREHGLPLINIKAGTEEYPILQLNAVRVACYELKVLVDQM